MVVFCLIIVVVVFIITLKQCTFPLHHWLAQLEPWVFLLLYVKELSLQVTLLVWWRLKVKCLFLNVHCFWIKFINKVCYYNQTISSSEAFFSYVALTIIFCINVLVGTNFKMNGGCWNSSSILGLVSVMNTFPLLFFKWFLWLAY